MRELLIIASFWLASLPTFAQFSEEQRLIDIIYERPKILDMGDLNGDGLPDFVFQIRDRIGAWAQHPGPDSLAFPFLFDSSYQFQSCRVADVDADGDADLIPDDSVNNIIWLCNDGIGNFEIKFIEFGNLHAFNDFDSDGDLDVLFTFANTTKLARQTEPGVFVTEDFLENVNINTALPYTFPDGSAGLIMQDYNGHLNLVSTVSSSEWVQEAVDESLPIHMVQYETSDIDFDGDLDLLAYSVVEKELYLFEFDNGSFTSTSTLLTDTHLERFAVGDIDGDSFPEVLALGSSDSDMSELLRLDNMNGSFSAATVSDVPVSKSGLLIHPSSQNEQGLFYFSTEHSERILEAQMSADGSSVETKIILGDLCRDISDVLHFDHDADGDFDLLLVSERSDALAVLRQDNSGFEQFPIILTEQIKNPERVWLDSSLANQPKVLVYSNTDNALWSVTGWPESELDYEIVQSALYDKQIELADVNQDALLDLVWVQDNLVHIRLQTTQGQYEETISLNPGLSHVRSIKTVDYDGDGDIDLLLRDQQFGLPLSQFFLLENRGDLNFENGNLVVQAPWITQGLFLDLNQDSKADFVCIETNGPDHVAVYLQQDGELILHELIAFDTSSGEILNIDYDLDNDEDLVLVRRDEIGQQQSTLLMQNDGTGSFSSQQLIPAFVKIDQIKSVDLNGDGSRDLLTTSEQEERLSVYYNTTSVTIEEIELADQIFLYPNPVEDQLRIELRPEGMEYHYEIYSLKGQKVLQGDCPPSIACPIDVSRLSAGAYVLSNSNGTRLRFVKQ